MFINLKLEFSNLSLCILLSFSLAFECFHIKYVFGFTFFFLWLPSTFLSLFMMKLNNEIVRK